MNIHKKPRGNKAKRDKDSILADTKNLLYVLYGWWQWLEWDERRLCITFKKGIYYKRKTE